jgi:hypothetical protein
MAVVLDPHGRAWSVHRDWWPFPGDFSDFTDVIEIAIGLLFVLMWQFWLATKFLGARWVIRVERDGHEVGRELVRGGRRAKARVNQITSQIANGDRSGSYTI